MDFKLRRRFRVFPGFTINISLLGLSTTIGVKGLSVNLGKKGTYLNLGFPGTGIYDRIRLDGSSENNKNSKYSKFKSNQDYVSTSKEVQSAFDVGEEETISTYILHSIIESFKSESLESISLSSAVSFAETMREILIERKEILKDIDLVLAELVEANKNESKLRSKLLSLFNSEDILQSELLQYQYSKLNESLPSCSVKLDVEFDDESKVLYNNFLNAFSGLSSSEIIYDITDRIDLEDEHPKAESFIKREVDLLIGKIDIISFELDVPLFENYHGPNMYFYPSYLILLNSEEEYAVIDFSKVIITLEDFIVKHDNENGPTDTSIFRIEKEYTPFFVKVENGEDLGTLARFAQISFTSNSGLNEKYVFSNYKSAESFYQTFLRYQNITKL